MSSASPGRLPESVATLAKRLRLPALTCVAWSEKEGWRRELLSPPRVLASSSPRLYAPTNFRHHAALARHLACDGPTVVA